MSQLLALQKIRTDKGIQPRVTLDPRVVKEYKQDMKRGDEFPPITVFDDQGDYWLADGFHRHAAATSLGRTEITADVRKGTWRDAVLYSVGANRKHGKRRTNEDKRRAVLTLLNDPHWERWSDRNCSTHPLPHILLNLLGYLLSTKKLAESSCNSKTAVIL